MRIGLVSDTHLLSEKERLPLLLHTALGQSDLILHAGDLEVLSVLDELGEIAPVLAARGYGDPRPPGEQRVAEVNVHLLDGLRVGLVHDIAHPAYRIRAVGTAAELHFPPEPLAQLLALRFGGPVDLVVFGDTHVPTILQREGILLVNPGSPTRPHLPAHRRNVGTVGLLDLELDRIRIRLLLLEPGLPLLLSGDFPRPAA